MHITTDTVNTPEGFKEVYDFAATFDHKPSGRYPVLILKESGRSIGYVELINQPVVLAAFAPEHPRACIEAVRKLKAWQEMQHGIGLTLAPRKADLYKHMERLGFINTGLELFKTA